MVTIHPPPVWELVERIRTTLEWERWYRERQNQDRPAVQAMKLQDIDGALVALEQLEAIAREGSA
jgi:hypothetical protein